MKKINKKELLLFLIAIITIITSILTLINPKDTLYLLISQICVLSLMVSMGITEIKKGEHKKSAYIYIGIAIFIFIIMIRTIIVKQLF